MTIRHNLAHDQKRYFANLLASSPSSTNRLNRHGVFMVVNHTADIVISIQLNRAINEHNLQDISGKIGIDIPGDDPIWFGGPHAQDKIHIIHSTDWMGSTSVKLTDSIAMTNDLSILSAMSVGDGPSKFRACAGFFSWSPGEFARLMSSRLVPDGLIRQVAKWEAVPATSELTFDSGHDDDQWLAVLEASVAHQASQYF